MNNKEIYEFGFRRILNNYSLKSRCIVAKYIHQAAKQRGKYS